MTQSLRDTSEPQFLLASALLPEDSNLLLAHTHSKLLFSSLMLAQLLWPANSGGGRRESLLSTPCHLALRWPHLLLSVWIHGSDSPQRDVRDFVLSLAWTLVWVSLASASNDEWISKCPVQISTQCFKTYSNLIRASWGCKTGLEILWDLSQDCWYILLLAGLKNSKGHPFPQYSNSGQNWGAQRCVNKKYS